VKAPYAECGGDNSKLIIPFNGAGIISYKIPILVVIYGRPFGLIAMSVGKYKTLVVVLHGITIIIFEDYDLKGQLVK
jgi:beta-glucosidase